MNPEWLAQKDFLEPFYLYLKASGLPTRLVSPKTHSAYYSLVTTFPGLGMREADINFELILLPGTMNSEGGNRLLQMLAVLVHDVQEERLAVLNRLCGVLNARLPMGFFGIIEDSRDIFIKQSLVFSPEIPATLRIQMIDQHLGMLVAMVNLFIDTILAVAQGGASVEASLESHPMRSAFFPEKRSRDDRKQKG